MELEYISNAGIRIKGTAILMLLSYENVRPGQVTSPGEQVVIRQTFRKVGLTSSGVLSSAISSSDDHQRLVTS